LSIIQAPLKEGSEDFSLVRSSPFEMT